jgi:biotin synthase-like enzyme
MAWDQAAGTEFRGEVMEEQIEHKIQTELDKLSLASEQAVALSAAMRALSMARYTMPVSDVHRYIGTLLPMFEDQITEITECGVDIMMMVSVHIGKPRDEP